MTNLDHLPPGLLNPSQRDQMIAFLLNLGLTATIRKKTFRDWSIGVGYAATSADYTALEADIT